MRFIEIKAPAKINIGLNIVEKRSDGYHNLETFFYPIKDLFDTISFTRSEKFSFRTRNRELQNDSSNLILKTKELLEKETGKEFNVNIELIKRIPMGAGLGGGSSDAAATIISLNEMFDLKLDYKKQIELGLKLGSDVPFFLKAKPAIGYSRGEKLIIRNDFILDKPILLVNPGIHISTKEAFENIQPKSSLVDYKSVFSNFENFYENKDKLINDFEAYVFEKYPKIGTIKNIIKEYGAKFTMMSGSGSTVYGIFDSIEEAKSVKGKVESSYFTFISG